MARPIDPRPTLREIMKHQEVTLARLIVTIMGVSSKDVEQIVIKGAGTPEDIDLCLKGLSFLTKQEYTRRVVGGFTYLGSKTDQVRYRHYKLAEDTSSQNLQQLREYEVTIEGTLHPSSLSRKWMMVLPAYWKMTVPPGTYYASFPGRMFEGRGVTNDDLLMILPLGLQVHARMHQIDQNIYHQIMGIYDPLVVKL